MRVSDFLKEYVTCAIGAFVVAYTSSTILQQKIPNKEETLVLGGLALAFPVAIVGAIYITSYEFLHPEKEIIWRVKITEREKTNKKD